MRNLVSVRTRGRRRGRVAIAAALTSCIAVVGVASAAVGGFNPFGNQQVSQTYANGILLPTNQWISPLGTRILDDNARLVSSTISPNGEYLAALGWNEFSGFLTIVNLQDRQDRLPDRPRHGLRQRRGLLRRAPTAPCSRLTAAPSGSRSRPGSRSSASARRPVRPPRRARSHCAARLSPRRRVIRTSVRATRAGPGCRPGMALSPDGNTLYVALNGNNTLGVINTADRCVDRQDRGRQRPASGRPRRRRQGRLRLERGRSPGDDQRLHQPVRRYADRVEPQDRWGGHRHRLRGQPDDAQGDTGDPGRPAADCALPGRQRTVRRQLERRQPVGDRREQQHGRPDGADQSRPGRTGRQLRERDQHVRSEPRPGQHRP